MEEETKGKGGMIGFLVGLTIMIIIGIFIFSTITSSIEDVDWNNESNETFARFFESYKFIPIAPAIFIIVPIIFFALMFGGEIPDEEYEYYEPYVEPDTKIRITDAKKILKLRYAKGEIDSLEYTERMSRL